jgi:hypothetical protein
LEFGDNLEWACKFQSTPPRGGRLSDFNSLKSIIK